MAEVVEGEGSGRAEMATATCGFSRRPSNVAMREKGKQRQVEQWRGGSPAGEEGKSGDPLGGGTTVEGGEEGRDPGAVIEGLGLGEGSEGKVGCIMR